MRQAAYHNPIGKKTVRAPEAVADIRAEIQDLNIRFELLPSAVVISLSTGC